MSFFIIQWKIVAWFTLRWAREANLLPGGLKPSVLHCWQWLLGVSNHSGLQTLHCRRGEKGERYVLFAIELLFSVLKKKILDYISSFHLDKSRQGWGRHYKGECRVKTLLAIFGKEATQETLQKDLSLTKMDTFRGVIENWMWKVALFYLHFFNKTKYSDLLIYNFSKAPYTKDSTTSGWEPAHEAFDAPKTEKWIPLPSATKSMLAQVTHLLSYLQ